MEKCLKNHLNEEQLIKEFKEICVGKQECEFNLQKYANDISTIDENLVNKECFSEFAKVYIQFSCDFTDLVGE